MNKRFREKNIVITKAGSHIGRASAIRLAQEGANLILIDDDHQSLMVTMQELPEDTSWLHENDYLPITCDISSPDQTNKMIAAIDRQFDAVDIFVDISSEESKFNYLLEKLAPYLKNSNGNVVSLLSLDTESTILEANTKSLCDNGVRLNQVIFSESAELPIKDKTRKDKVRKKPKQNALSLKRKVNIDDVVDAVTFLVSDEASMITGIKLLVDGGVRFNTP